MGERAFSIENFENTDLLKDTSILVDLQMRQVRKAIAPRLKELSQLNEIKSLEAVGVSWALIIGSICASLYLHDPLSYFLAILMIAPRQHGLLALMHEGVHFRLSNNIKTNDYISDFFAAFPIFMKTSIYRQHHSLHHRNLNTENDPDWVRKSPLLEWQFPMTKKSFLKRYSKYLWGFGVLETFKLCAYLSGLGNKKKEFFTQITYYAAVFFLFTYFHVWRIFVLYWIVPGLTIFPLLMKLRSIAEHFGLANSNILNKTRNVYCPLFERVFILPFHLSYHLDHHLFPTVPFYNLPKLNKILSQHDVYRDHAHQNSSYLGLSKTSLLKDLFSTANL